MRTTKINYQPDSVFLKCRIMEHLETLLPEIDSLFVRIQTSEDHRLLLDMNSRLEEEDTENKLLMFKIDNALKSACSKSKELLPVWRQISDSENGVLYALTAYDKDGGSTYYYDILNDLSQLIWEGEILKPKVEEEELRNPNTNEPFDWLEITPKAHPDLLYWADYDLPYAPIERNIYLLLQAQ